VAQAKRTAKKLPDGEMASENLRTFTVAGRVIAYPNTARGGKPA
jgi:hypothetical protein